MEIFLLIQVMMKIGMVLLHQRNGRELLEKLLQCHQMEGLQMEKIIRI